MNLGKRLDALEETALQEKINELYKPLTNAELVAMWTGFAWGIFPSERCKTLAIEAKVAMYRRASPVLRPVLWPPEERELLEKGTSGWADLEVDPVIEDPLEDLNREHEPGLTLADLLCTWEEYQERKAQREELREPPRPPWEDGPVTH